MKKSMLSGWSSIPGGILFFGDYVYICTLGFTRYRALLSADADGTLVNRPRKTNATFGGACFSFGLDYIIAPWFFGLDQVSKSDIV